MAKLLKVDGSIEHVTIPEDADFKFYQKVVSGRLYQLLRIPAETGWDFVIMDEEGKLVGKPVNEEATRIGHDYGFIFAGDRLVGDILFITKEEYLDEDELKDFE